MMILLCRIPNTTQVLLILIIIYIVVFGTTLFLHMQRLLTEETVLADSRLGPFQSTTAAITANDDDKWWLGKIQSESEGPLKHPHMGAQHKNGTVGMLVNPSPTRLQVVDITKVSNTVCSSVPSSLSSFSTGSSQESFRYGIEGKGGRQVLDKVRGEEDEVKKGTNTNQQKRSSRILCLVYSVHLTPNGKNDHVANHANLRAVAQTWGRKCDGFIGASNLTDHSIGAVDLLHNGPEEYGNMWQKG
jgi:hypothetical protein